MDFLKAYMGCRIVKKLIVLIVFLALTIPSNLHARELFYLLDGTKTDNSSIKVYSLSGEYQYEFAVPVWSDSAGYSGLATDGYTAYIANLYDRDFIDSFQIRSGGVGGSIPLQTADQPSWGYCKGLALNDGTVWISRDTFEPEYRRIEYYNRESGDYGGKFFIGPLFPGSMQYVGSTLIVHTGGVYFYSGTGNLQGSFSPGTFGTHALSATSDTIYLHDATNATAFTWGGVRVPSKDIAIFSGLSSLKDAYIAWGPEEPVLSVSLPSIDFGPVKAGESKAVNITLKNVGTETLSITDFSLSDTTNYSHTGSAPLSLPPGQSQTLSVMFAPLAAGSCSAALAISSNSRNDGSSQTVIALTGAGKSGIFFLDGGVSVSGVGTSWGTAFKTIGEAVANSNVLDNAEIWVKAGTYVLSQTIVLNKSLALYGGFAGTETERSQRNYDANETIVDGSDAVRCLHVLASNCILDGFTVTRGSAVNSSGGGIHIGPVESPWNGIAGTVIQNCRIRGNDSSSGWGGGISVGGYTTDTSIVNCQISENRAVYGGGVAANYGKKITIDQCRLTDNEASTFGGGIYGSMPYTEGAPESDRVVIANSIIAGNTASSTGGGLYLSGNMASSSSSTTDFDIRNCLISGNTLTDSSGTASGMYAYYSLTRMTNCTMAGNGAGGAVVVAYADKRPVITNCIIWGNEKGPNPDSTEYQLVRTSGAQPIVTYSNIDQWNYRLSGTAESDTNRNFRKDPGFINPAGPDGDPAAWEDNDYSLRPGSPCIDYGNGDAAPVTDILENPRHDDHGIENQGTGTPTYVDIGTYEFQGTTPAMVFFDPGASGSNDGSSWENAFSSLQAAVDASGEGKEVWIKAGRHVLTEPLLLNKSVVLLGGFSGNEYQAEMRDWKANETILDGNGTLKHCLFISANAVVDGITITGGNANVEDYIDGDRGGAIYINQVSPVIQNCRFTGNYALARGGAIYAYLSNPTLFGNFFTLNTAGQMGGAISSYKSAWGMDQNIFSGNRATNSGGALYLQDSSGNTSIKNSLFTGNSAMYGGGAIYNNSYNDTGSQTIVNCTFHGNRGGSGGGAIYSWRSSRNIVNSILWGNAANSGKEIYNWDATTDLFHCAIEGGYAGGTNLVTIDPKFLSTGAWNDSGTPADQSDDTWTNGRYLLRSGSPCIDAGTQDGAPDHDIDGTARPLGTQYDIGAYEFDPAAPLLVTVALSATGQGAVSITPESDLYLTGSQITLQANAQPGWGFDGWSGDIEGYENPVSITLTGDLNISAHFVLIGDVDDSGSANLTDAVTAFQIIAGIDTGGNVHRGADVNGDEKIGLAEALYILQKTAGLR